mmetsp:Transcript_13299/g.37823  ORF Transcript_13299/g.37823 Transcript_13299/m.37823 type:complete len:100 (+) Transcript_13299:358-657(+)
MSDGTKEYILLSNLEFLREFLSFPGFMSIIFTLFPNGYNWEEKSIQTVNLIKLFLLVCTKDVQQISLAFGKPTPMTPHRLKMGLFLVIHMEMSMLLFLK